MTTGLLCPNCGNRAHQVTDSRPAVAAHRRRRSCACGYRFTTIETILPPRPSDRLYATGKPST